MTTPKEEEILADWKKAYSKMTDNYIGDEIADYWLKIRREAIAEERERVNKGIKEVYQNAKEDHICRFNDGDCNCECYYTAINDVISHLTQE